MKTWRREMMLTGIISYGWLTSLTCGFGLSFRNLKEMMAERNLRVDHATIWRWVQRYAPELYCSGPAGQHRGCKSDPLNHAATSSSS
jgi:hypothetical protein